jgi:aspartyl aminopeptidase
MALIQTDFIRDLLRFISDAPTSFHTVHNICQILTSNGFTELPEQDHWDIKSDGTYFVRRNSSSLILLTLNGQGLESGLRMAGAHTDSPSLKIKPNPGQTNHSYLQLGVETYGG